MFDASLHYVVYLSSILWCAEQPLIVCNTFTHSVLNKASHCLTDVQEVVVGVVFFFGSVFYNNNIQKVGLVIWANIACNQ